MNTSSCTSRWSSQSTTPNTNNNNDVKKIRKPYTITKSRESWTDEEHDKFLEALQLFDRDWKKIEDFVGSKTVIQVLIQLCEELSKSHAQKYFLKVQKNGTTAHLPPPRPKRKAAHPYPQKAPKSVLIQNQSDGTMSSPDDYNHEVEAGRNSSTGAVGSSNSTMANTELPEHRTEGILDFVEVYNFIGSVFDPETEGHMQKLKEMDPINFETVLLLMKNLTVNLSSPDFEPFQHR